MKRLLKAIANSRNICFTLKDMTAWGLKRISIENPATTIDAKLSVDEECKSDWKPMAKLSENRRLYKTPSF